MGEEIVLCIGLCGNEFQSGVVPGSRKERALDPELTGSREKNLMFSVGTH